MRHSPSSCTTRFRRIAHQADDDDQPIWAYPDATGEVDIFRFVSTDDRESPAFVDGFKSDRARDIEPSARERRHPELHDSISAYRTLVDARRFWWQIADRVGANRVRLGPWIARVRLIPGRGFKYELSDDPTGHIYVNGSPIMLADAVVELIDVRQSS